MTSRWYHKITADPANFLQPFGDAMSYFHAEYDEAVKSIQPQRGALMWSTSMQLGAIMEQRFGQLQEIEAILKFLELQYDIVHGRKKRNYMENHARVLKDREASDMADIEQEVILIRTCIIEASFVRNLFTSVTKGLEFLHFQIGHMTKLKIAGIEDTTF